jgi:hypothetical protein
VSARAFVTAFCAALLLAVPAAANGFPWKAGDKPPAVAGIALGDSEQHALDVLGPPDDSASMPAGDVLRYTEKGLEITAATRHVSVIALLKPEAGAIGGLRVGDKARDVILKLGAPQDGNGRLARFGAGDWLIIVRLAPKESVIEEIALVSAQAPGIVPAPNINVFKTQ